MSNPTRYRYRDLKPGDALRATACALLVIVLVSCAGKPEAAKALSDPTSVEFPAADFTELAAGGAWKRVEGEALGYCRAMVWSMPFEDPHSMLYLEWREIDHEAYTDVAIKTMHTPLPAHLHTHLNTLVNLRSVPAPNADQCIFEVELIAVPEQGDSRESLLRIWMRKPGEYRIKVFSKGQAVTLDQLVAGDVIEYLQDGHRYKFYLDGIRCPREGEAGWAEMRAAALKLIAEKQILLHFITRGYSGFASGHVTLHDGRDLANELVFAGLCKATTQQPQ